MQQVSVSTELDTLMNNGRLAYVGCIFSEIVNVENVLWHLSPNH
jgi:16S rRNA C967 or C1407 C5-methylase (RsmB/RsmF family)